MGITIIPDVYAEKWYYYVEPLPDYASFASNVMDLSTTAWETANPGLEFIEVNSPQQANFQVQWVKEFGVEHAGYAFGSWFIEVGLGDSNCGNGMWQPYSEKYVTHIMTHEIGHVLGLGHDNDPDSIMYPVALNWEYGNVEISKTLTNNYGYFQPICTSKSLTTFDWHVSTDDPTYGFDVYFVPSVDEFNKWAAGESFSYFQGNGCSATSMLSVGGTCEGVPQNSGLLVIMGDTTTQPLTEITLNTQENISYQSSAGSDPNDSTIATPTSDPTSSIDVTNTFSLYVDPQQQFSIKYPSNWLVFDDESCGSEVCFVDNYDWTAQLFVTDYGEQEYTGLSDSEIMDTVITFEQEWCDNAIVNEAEYTCDDFELISSQSGVLDSGEPYYLVTYTDTRQYDLAPGTEHPITTQLLEIHDGSNVWTAYFEVATYAFDDFSDILIESIGSFQLIKAGEGSNTNAIPTPTEPSAVIITGTASIFPNKIEWTSDNQSAEVKIYGTVDDVDKATQIGITFTYPDGTTDGYSIFTRESGNYEAYYPLGTSSPKGVYEVLITSQGTVLGTLELTVADKILDLQSEPEPATEPEPIPELEPVTELEPDAEPDAEPEMTSGEEPAFEPTTKSEAAQASGGCGAGTVLKGNTCVLDKSSGGSLPEFEVLAIIGATIIGIIFGVWKAIKRNVNNQKPSSPSTQSVSSTVGNVMKILDGDLSETAERKARQQELEEYEEKYLARQGQRPTRKPAEKKETPMFCNNCGAAFKKSEAKFCGECGTPRS